MKQYNFEQCTYYHQGDCSLNAPDSILPCTCNFNKQIIQDLTGETKMEETKKEGVKIEGVGKDAEIVENAQGGKQSKSPMALHLVDPYFLEKLFDIYSGDSIKVAMKHIARYMQDPDKEEKALYKAMDCLTYYNGDKLIAIGKVLQEGAEKYEVNNWRLIPQEEHINHALIHLLALSKEDTQDDHKAHALTRLMMAIATKPSKGFSYTEYIKKES
ncbi:MAG: DUF5664 domain-containing protein [Candidatus Gastranaerophilales bacterium]|nr:DUF5664 domain-containing protein [Candidatus Gastranaerophilales bacterium]